MVLDRQQAQLKRVRDFLSLAILPIQYGVVIPQDIYHGLEARFRTRQALVADNQNLQKEVMALRQRLQQMMTMEAEVNRLKILLKTNARAGDKVGVAEVMNIDMAPGTQRVWISRGAQDDVYEGQPVVDAFGIMGQVIEVGPISSVVLLISDKQHAIPVQSERSGARAIAMGSGAPDELLLKHVTATSDFQVGDKLLSSGFGQRFPKGYPVGVITAIQKEGSDRFATIVVKPYAHIDVAREVLLIWPEGLTGKELSIRARQGAKESTNDAHPKG